MRTRLRERGNREDRKERAYVKNFFPREVTRRRPSDQRGKGSGEHVIKAPL